MRSAFFDLYPGLTDYHEKMRKAVRFAKQVESPLGRIRHLPMIDAWDKEVKSRAERQAINSPIQATLTDMMIWAIARIEQEYGDDIACVGMVHDQVLAYVDEDKVELRAKQAKEIMESLPFHEFGWEPQLAFPADAEWGHNMAQTTKLKLAA
jgi:DNA polymerase I-like protein with 3'-5' exonuclease and polymerase domains